MTMKQGYLCEDLDLNKWVLLEANLILEEGVKLEVLNSSEEWPKWEWQKAVVKFNNEYNELAIHLYETGNYLKISSNYIVRVTD